MYLIGGYVFAFFGLAVAVTFLLVRLVSHLIGWVNDEKRELVGSKTLKKMGCGESGDIIWMSAVFFTLCLVASFVWPFAIFAGFVTVAVFALRYFNRFKRRVDKALGKAKK